MDTSDGIQILRWGRLAPTLHDHSGASISGQRGALARGDALNYSGNNHAAPISYFVRPYNSACSWSAWLTLCDHLGNGFLFHGRKEGPDSAGVR